MSNLPRRAEIMMDVKKRFRATEATQKMLKDGERKLRDVLIKQIREIQQLDEIYDTTLALILLRAKGQGVDVAGHLVRSDDVMVAPRIADATDLAKIALGAEPESILGMYHSAKQNLLQSIIRELESREQIILHDEAAILREAFGI